MTEAVAHDLDAATAGDAPVVATGLVKSFLAPDGSRVAAVDGIDFVAPRGEISAIVGPSGSGKTTLLQLLAGLDRPDEGSIRLAGVEISRADDATVTRLRRREVGFVFQSFNLVPGLPARDNIVLPVRLDGRAVDQVRLLELAERLGIAGRLDHTPEQLSGGQKQRVAVARALFAEPAIVFADEPTGALDAESAENLLGVIGEAVADLGQTVVLVTHDLAVAELAGSVHVLRAGKLERQR
ncbi:MAG: transporter [Marmoricola sp.]|nr:transporter [Marmoricola sp.]